ncbi:MAG: hypothetical protein CL609_24170 [Anaerolineaceae bacterium]|nr:hypothetical protein [Anaerolineaceae bacterium]
MRKNPHFLKDSDGKIRKKNSALEKTLKAVKTRFNNKEWNKNYQDALRGLYELGKTGSKHIKKLQPDLILVLGHGGIGVLWAVEALWQLTHQRNLPPVLVVNLGTEKIRRYESAREGLPFIHTHPFVPDYSSTIECGFFLAWLKTQYDWLNTLDELIRNRFSGKSPASILVLDDAYVTGSTHRLALGLLLALYPDCQVDFLAGDTFEWRNELAQVWIKNQSKKAAASQTNTYGIDIFHIAQGTEDLDDKESLGWRPLSKNNPALQSLAELLPAEQWLELPVWMKNTIQKGVVAQTKDPKNEPFDNTLRMMCAGLNSDELFFRKLWLSDSITHTELSQLLNLPENEMNKKLGFYLDENEIQVTTVDGEKIVQLPPELSKFKQRFNFSK